MDSNYNEKDFNFSVIRDFLRKNPFLIGDTELEYYDSEQVLQASISYVSKPNDIGDILSIHTSLFRNIDKLPLREYHYHAAVYKTLIPLLHPFYSDEVNEFYKYAACYMFFGYSMFGDFVMPVPNEFIKEFGYTFQETDLCLLEQRQDDYWVFKERSFLCYYLALYEFEKKVLYVYTETMPSEFFDLSDYHPKSYILYFFDTFLREFYFQRYSEDHLGSLQGRLSLFRNPQPLDHTTAIWMISTSPKIQLDVVENEELLKGFRGLKYLTLTMDGLLPDVSFLAELRLLTLKNVQVTTFFPLQKLKKLRVLELENISSGVLDELFELTQLTALRLENMPVRSLEKIDGLTNLNHLELINLPLTDITCIMSLPNLTYLQIHHIPKECDLDFLKNTNIKLEVTE